MSYGQKGMQKARKAWKTAKKDERDSDDAYNSKTAYKCRSLSMFSSRETGSLDGRVTG